MRPGVKICQISSMAPNAATRTMAMSMARATVRCGKETRSVAAANQPPTVKATKWANLSESKKAASGNASRVRDDIPRIPAAQPSNAHQRRQAMMRDVIQTTNMDGLEGTSRMLPVAIFVQVRAPLARWTEGEWGDVPSWHADCFLHQHPFWRIKTQGSWPRSLVGSVSIESGGNSIV